MRRDPHEHAASSSLLRRVLLVAFFLAGASGVAGCGGGPEHNPNLLPEHEMLGRELALALTYDQMRAPDVAELLAAGANPNARIPQKLTPTPLGWENTAIMAAAYFGRPEIVALLLRAGANPCERDARGADARWFAAEGTRAFADAPRGHDAVHYLLQSARCL
jgi:hypothetical protein